MSSAPHPLCTHCMQVHHIDQETSDVWTLFLSCSEGYDYEPGQFALVSINNSGTLRAYTISSTPGISPYVALTVRRLPDGLGSRWLTEQVRPGDEIWLSSAQGDFTCAQHNDKRYLFMAAGCGVTPIISMCRWLEVNRPQTNVQVIYSVRSPDDIIFNEEWRDLQRWLRLTVFAEQGAEGNILPGRVTREHLAELVADIAQRRVMVCGPVPYMDQVASDTAALGVTLYEQEQFHVPAIAAEGQQDEAGAGQLKVTVAHLAQDFHVQTGVTLLEALKSNNVPVMAICNAGFCGSCKTRVLKGEHSVSSTTTLTPEEIAEGYVLACACHLKGDVVVA